TSLKSNLEDYGGKGGEKATTVLDENHKQNCSKQFNNVLMESFTMTKNANRLKLAEDLLQRVTAALVKMWPWSTWSTTLAAAALGRGIVSPRQPSTGHHRCGLTGTASPALNWSCWRHRREMVEEVLFLLLHNEMVPGVYKSAEQGDVENGRCITKMENLGFRVGQGLLERFTKDTARFKDELDIMKFILFKKQIDNLRTHRQGIYVLQGNRFRLLTQLSGGKQYLEHASMYLAFTCGLIGGGLSNLGIKSIVTAEVSSMPACKFQVMIQKL
ncbi:hypothetical protein U0070_017295, partial [Myodes glareolus]